VNWLAHLRLAPPEPLLRIGNLCGDFVRGVDVASLHPDLRRGIAMHRAVDAFVDAHAIVRGSKARLDAPFGRFGGVLIDVFYDHFLARDWELLGDGGTLAEFAGSVHELLREHSTLLPPRLLHALPWMEREGWLEGYAQIEGIGDVLSRMARRLKHENPLAEGVSQLRAHYGALEGDFAAFWPELEAFSRELPNG
jgi:acyl carrier protein phosphodiesterase